MSEGIQKTITVVWKGQPKQYGNMWSIGLLDKASQGEESGQFYNMYGATIEEATAKAEDITKGDVLDAIVKGKEILSFKKLERVSSEKSKSASADSKGNYWDERLQRDIENDKLKLENDKKIRRAGALNTAVEILNERTGSEFSAEQILVAAKKMAEDIETWIGSVGK